MKFEIYSKPGCPYCDKIKVVMGQYNLEHTVKTLYEDFSKQDFYAKFGEGSTFPQVIGNDEHLGGCVDTVKTLRERGII
jgi:glutaredoxin 3